MLKRSKYFLLILIILTSAFGTSHGNIPVSSISQLNSPEYTIGTDQDGAMLALVEAKFPAAGKKYFSDKTGGYAALLSGKIDAFVENNYEADYDIRNGLKGVKILPGSLADGVKISAGLSKTSSIPGLEEKFNIFIERSKSDGTIDSMIRRWVYGGSSEMPDIDVPEKSELRVVLGTTGLVVPFSFYVSNKITGLDVELARRFAASIGAELEVKVYDFGGLLMALSTGEVDVALSNLYYSRENSGSLKFSDVLYTVEPVVIVRDDMHPASDSGKFSAFSGKRIGVFTGSVQYEMVKKNIPGAEIAYFDVIANVMAEITSGKVDAAALDETIVAEFERANPDLTHIPETLGDSETAFLFPKSKRNNPLLDEINEYIRRIKSDGTLNDIRAVWSGTDESKKVIPDYSGLPATKGTIRIAIDNETPLFAYMKDRRLVGYDVDVIVRFCKERGYKPDFNIINFPGIIPAVSSGKCDMGAGGITITPERAENVRFSEPLYAVSSFLLVKKPAASQPVTTKPADSKPAVKHPAISDFDGKVIAVNSGTLHPDFVMEVLPHAKLLRFDGDMNMFTALMTGKADAAVEDEIILLGFMKEHDGYEFVDGYLKTFDNGFIFAKDSKGAKLRDEFNEYLKRIKSDGTLQSIHDLWFGNDESLKTLPDYEAYPDTNGVIDIALYAEVPPMDYVKEGRPAGYEPDIAVRFCKEKGYRPRITISNFDSVIPNVISGKAQIGLAVLSITEERKESVNFSEPIYTGGSRLIVKKSGGSSAPAKSNASAGRPKYSRLSELDGKPIGMQPGILDWEKWVAENLPHSKVQYYNTYPDLASALKTQKIEGFLVDSPVLALMAAEDDKLTAIDEIVGEIFGYSFAFAKTEEGKKLSNEMSEFILKLKASGELDAIHSKWQGADEAVKVITDFKNLPATNGTLTFAIEGSYPPFNYYKGTNMAGIDVDLAVRFCEAYGYGLNVTTVVWDAMIPGLISGKVNFVPDFTPSEEHEEAVNFSEPYCTAHSVMACLKADSQPAKPSAKRRDLDSFAGKTIAVQTGTASETLVPEKLPSAKIAYYDSLTNQITAVKSGKADALATSLPPAIMMVNEDSSLEIIDPPLRETYFYQMFANTEKGKKLCAEYSAFLKTLWDNGTIDALGDKWLGADDSKKTVNDYSSLPGTNGTVRMAVDAQFPPFVYIKDNRIVGHNIELAVMFCKAKGYSLVIENMTLSGAIASVKTGKSDFSQSMNKTPEREENTIFTSTPTIKAGNVLVALKSKESDTEGISSLKVSDFEGKNVGLMIGSDSAKKIEEKIPGVKILFFDSPSHILPSLRSGKIDAFYCALPTAKNIIQLHHDLAYIPEYVNTTRHTAMFPKSENGRKLCAEYADFLKTISDDGTLDKLAEKWLTGNDESKQVTEDHSNLPATNGTLTMSVTEGLMPFVFVKDNRIQGYDIDLAVLFCKHKGCGLNIEITNHNGVLSSLETGKCDFTYSVQWTEERDKTVLFSPVPNAVTGSVLVVMRQDTQSARTDLSDFRTKRIGVPTATSNAEIVEEVLPDAKLVYFDSPSEMLPALRQGKIDAFSCALPTIFFIMEENNDIEYLPEPLKKSYHSATFTPSEKGRKLCEKYSAFMKNLWDNGTIDKLFSKWFKEGEEARHTEEYGDLPATNGTLKMAVDVAMIPFVYVKDNRIQGYDIDLAVMFCKAEGYGLELVPISRLGALEAVKSGKCDLSYAMAQTEERAKSVVFASVPNSENDNVLVILKPVTPQPQKPVNDEPSFLDDLGSSFGKTFVREERWRLFAEGIANTMLITVASIFFGMLLGFTAFMFCRTGNVVANVFTKFSVWLIKGTPNVVLLMILYYIIFGHVNISGIVVSIIAFTLTFGTSVYRMLTFGTGAVDRGQTEAAYALGFTDLQTFFTVILPQAALHFMPSLREEVTLLIKSTSIVGYIAVQDLTKMGDIVRSRTYEAFFPLIAVALIYFVLAGILNSAVTIVQTRITPSKRKPEDILRGIKTEGEVNHD